jgi:hypothetical protein
MEVFRGFTTFKNVYNDGKHIVTTQQAGCLGFNSWQVKIFFITTMSGLPLGAHPASYPVGTGDKVASA